MQHLKFVVPGIFAVAALALAVGVSAQTPPLLARPGGQAPSNGPMLATTWTAQPRPSTRPT